MRYNNLMRLRSLSKYIYNKQSRNKSPSLLALLLFLTPLPFPAAQRIISDILHVGGARTAAKMFVKVQIQ